MADRVKKKRKKRTWRFRRRRLKNVAILPTLITLGNIVCGTIAIFRTALGFSKAGAGQAEAANGEFYAAAWFILLAMVFDALDGRVARLTKTASNFGAQLDSLCDLVSFGVAPAFLVYCICRENPFPERLVTVLCIFFVICAVVRLARFNIETTTDIKTHMDFSGLPSPASAGVIAASVLPWTAFKEHGFLDAIRSVVATGLPFITLFLAVLMISRIGYPHVLNKLFRGPRPFFVFVEVILVGILVVLFHEFAIFLAFTGFAVSGPAWWIRQRLRRSRTETEPEGAPQEESLF